MALPITQSGRSPRDASHCVFDCDDQPNCVPYRHTIAHGDTQSHSIAQSHEHTHSNADDGADLNAHRDAKPGTSANARWHA